MSTINEILTRQKKKRSTLLVQQNYAVFCKITVCSSSIPYVTIVIGES